MMNEVSFYENVDMYVFGKRFTSSSPVEIFEHFRRRSPFLREKGKEGYLEHLSRFVNIPTQEEGETEVAYYDRIFDVLARHKMVYIKDFVIH